MQSKRMQRQKGQQEAQSQEEATVGHKSSPVHPEDSFRFLCLSLNIRIPAVFMLEVSGWSNNVLLLTPFLKNK